MQDSRGLKQPAQNPTTTRNKLSQKSYGDQNPVHQFLSQVCHGSQSSLRFPQSLRLIEILHRTLIPSPQACKSPILAQETQLNAPILSERPRAPNTPNGHEKKNPLNATQDPPQRRSSLPKSRHSWIQTRDSEACKSPERSKPRQSERTNNVG